MSKVQTFAHVLKHHYSVVSFTRSPSVFREYPRDLSFRAPTAVSPKRGYPRDLSVDGLFPELAPSSVGVTRGYPRHFCQLPGATKKMRACGAHHGDNACESLSVCFWHVRSTLATYGVELVSVAAEFCVGVSAVGSF